MGILGSCRGRPQDSLRQPWQGPIVDDVHPASDHPYHITKICRGFRYLKPCRISISILNRIAALMEDPSLVPEDCEEGQESFRPQTQPEMTRMLECAGGPPTFSKSPVSRGPKSVNKGELRVVCRGYYTGRVGSMYGVLTSGVGEL